MSRANVEQDPVEALAHYSMAAAQGDRLAETYRKSLQRKMTPEQMAAAEKRTLEIRKEIGQHQPARP